MSMQSVEADGPLIPMPAVTRQALREAVRHIRPLNLAQFDRELGEAFDQAVRTGSTGWMRGFLMKWATFVAIERWPERAAALRAAEAVSENPEASEARVREAQGEIARILDSAQQDSALWVRMSPRSQTCDQDPNSPFPYDRSPRVLVRR